MVSSVSENYVPICEWPVLSARHFFMSITAQPSYLTQYLECGHGKVDVLALIKK
jgi:hypothetical protein